MWFSVGLVFCLWWIPLLMRSMKDVIHYCPRCGIRLAIWFDSFKYLEIEPGIPQQKKTPTPSKAVPDSEASTLCSSTTLMDKESATCSSDVLRSPLGPWSAGQKRTAVTSVLSKFTFTTEKKRVIDKLKVTPTQGSTSTYTIRGNIPSAKGIDKNVISSPRLNFPLFLDFQVFRTTAAGENIVAGNITYAQNCWDSRLRLYRNEAGKDNGNRHGELRHMQVPIVLSIKTLMYLHSSRGMLRWDKGRRISGYGRGKPLVDRWGRVCALFKKGRSGFTGELIIFATQDDQGDATADSLWVDEIVLATVAMLPHPYRRHEWSNHHFPGSYNYSGGG